PGESGFDLLDSLPNRPFHLVFVTGFDHYAIRAIRTQALDYLLKPVDRHVLQATVNRVFERGEPSAAIAPIRPFSHKPESLTLYHAGGFDLVPFVDILYLKGEDNYTRFQLADGHSILVTRTLKEFEELLAPEGFLRIHKSSVINPRWIKSYRFENTGHVRMKNGEDLEVSRRRSKLLFEVIDRLSIGTKRSTRFRS
ncbi:MAG: LytTR family DNA-binding domain-containing protein, partial [Bacteroidota bacterium]